MSVEFIEKMEAYLEGQISREELQQLADAEGIEDLERELAWLQDSQIAVEAAGLRKQLEDVLPKPQKQEATVRKLKPIRIILAVAATILLLVVAYVGLTWDTEPALYAEYEYIDPGLPVLMSQSDDHQLYDALTYYSEGNYATAVEKLRQIQQQYSNSDTLSYYLGASLLYQGETAGARQALQQVLEAENSRFYQRAEWLLVLTALRANNETAARELVQAIVEIPEHEFYEEAERLQEELNE